MKSQPKDKSRDAQGNVLSVYTKEPVSMTIEHKLAERHIYGSSRLGMNTTEVEMIGAITPTEEFEYKLGDKQYECSNHLGNVLAVITDKKFARDDVVPDGVTDYYQPEVIASQDYSPFGVLLENRNWSSEEYRYLFNGMEKDDEISGAGNAYHTFFRGFDPRLVRWKSYDPKVNPWESPYAAMGNNPILYNDQLGDSVEYATLGDRVRVFFKKMFNREFREEHNRRKEELELYTYRIVEGAPDLGNAREVLTTHPRDLHTSAIDVEYSISGTGAPGSFAWFLPLYWKDVEWQLTKDKEKTFDRNQPFWRRTGTRSFSRTFEIQTNEPIIINTNAYPDEVTIIDDNNNVWIDHLMATAGDAYFSDTYSTLLGEVAIQRNRLVLQLPSSVDVVTITINTYGGIRNPLTGADNYGNTIWYLNYWKRGKTLSFRWPSFVPPTEEDDE